MERVREEKRGKLTLRIVTAKTGYSGVVVSDGKGRLALMHGDDPVELWRRLEQAAAKSSRDYVGFDGARARFLDFFYHGFKTPHYVKEERDYKLAAKRKLDTTVPLAQAANGSGGGAAVMKVYQTTNLLAPVEKAKLKDALLSPSGDAFVRAAAAFSLGGGKQALHEMDRIMRPLDCAKWTVVTYLPFLWRPEAHVFLKPTVTKDFAARVGHRFAHDYQPQLDYGVYESLVDLMRTTGDEIADLHPHDNIDIQSFVWVAGEYKEGDASSATFGNGAGKGSL